MKSISNTLFSHVILFILLVVYTGARAQCEENQLTGKSPAGVSSFYMGQSFTAGCDGQIMRVTIFSAVNDSAVSGLLRIYDTSTVNTTPAYTQSFDGFAVEIDSPAWIDLDIPFPVSQGEGYAFEYYASFEPQAQIFGAELYPGGFAFVSGVENPRVDFRFIVEIDPPTGMSKYNSSTELSLYPNPVEDMVHLTFSADEPTDATVRVLDIQGRAVLSEQLGTVSGKHVTTLDVQALSPGMYHVLLQTESGTAVRQLMVH